MILKANMENVHGIDVSWIHNTHNKGERNSDGCGVSMAASEGAAGPDMSLEALTSHENL